MAELTIRDDTHGVPDTWLDDDNTSTNYGSGTTFKVGTKTGIGAYSARGLLHFPLSAIPGGAIILTAKLSLTVYLQAANGEAARVRRVTENGWVEGEATWDDYKTSTAWSSGGGDYTSTDEVNWTLPTGTGDFDITGLKTLVDDAIALRSGDLHIVLMRVTEAAPEGVLTVRSGEYATAAERPRLIVDYALEDRSEPMNKLRSRIPIARRRPPIVGNVL